MTLNIGSQSIKLSKSQKQFLDKAEDFADQVLRNTKHILPHLGRICLISTFVEDGIRMMYQWTDQVDYIDELWSCGRFPASIFVIINMVVQLVASVLVLIRGLGLGLYGCGALFFCILYQLIGYQVLFESNYLLRNLALIGGVLLLLADCLSAPSKSTSLFAGLPSTADRTRPRSILQLTGRLLVVLMFLTTVRIRLDAFSFLWDLFGIVLIILVAFGYKTKLCALVLVIFLTLMNCYLNPWWTVPAERAMRDFLKYDFFQTLSVIGGLLLLVALGPGGVSLDEHKKKW